MNRLMTLSIIVLAFILVSFSGVFLWQHPSDEIVINEGGTEGGKDCISDDDCIPLSGTDAGCWNREDLPPARILETGMAGPDSCRCVNGSCVSGDAYYAGLIENAVEQRDAEACSVIRDPYYKDRCYRRVAEALEDAALCDNIQDNWTRNVCHEAINNNKREL